MTLPESSETRRFVRPADYYSSATPDRVLPRWVTFGCGAASIAFLVIFFLAAIFVRSDSLGSLVDMSLSMAIAEMKGLYAADIPPTIRESADKEITQMRENIRDGRISLTAVQPFVNSMREVSSDRRVTKAELERLTAVVRKINESASDPAPAADATAAAD